MKSKSKPLETKEVGVDVSMNGDVQVMVPSHLSEEDAKLLAKSMTLSLLEVSNNNPDAPEEDAYEDYKEQCSKEARKSASRDWNRLKIIDFSPKFVVDSAKPRAGSDSKYTMVDVSISYEGVVTVAVPAHLSVDDAALLAQIYALARLIVCEKEETSESEKTEGKNDPFTEYRNSCSEKARYSVEDDLSRSEITGYGASWS